MNPWQLLTEHQCDVARRALAQESAKTTHLVISLSGAHAYGFPSPDSDLDLKAIHIQSTQSLLGLRPEAPALDRCEVVDGVEIDYTSNEVGQVMAGILKGNGNYLERVLGHCTLQDSVWLKDLQDRIRPTLSRRFYNHYRGFAHQQLELLDKAPSAKKLLYVIRTALTGTHLLRTGEVVTDVTRLLEEHGFGWAKEVIRLKLDGEHAKLQPSQLAVWRGELLRVFDVLNSAHQNSALPESPNEIPSLDSWLVDLRCSQMNAPSALTK